jgi:hypothetical protein
MGDFTGIKVYCRVRPPLRRDQYEEAVVECSGSNTLKIANKSMSAKSNSATNYQLDHVFNQDCSQHAVFEKLRGSLDDCFQGYNCTVFAYGQTGTGKTHTMLGIDFWQMAIDQEDFDPYALRESESSWGTIPQAAQLLFSKIKLLKESGKLVSAQVSCSYLELYNERLYDLLGEQSAVSRQTDRGYAIREDKVKGVCVPGASDVIVSEEEEVLGLLWEGAKNRAVSATDMNEHSSRSHTIFQFVVEIEMKAEEGQPRLISRSKLNLVDLAGSETMKANKIASLSEKRIQELTSINQSLSCLGNCIRALSQAGRSHVPYRDSKLTRLLQDSLGGNTKTTFIVTISPGMDAYAETLSTLQFADRAKRVVVQVTKNEKLVAQEALKQANHEIARLKALLRSKSNLEKGEALREKLQETMSKGTKAISGESARSGSKRIVELQAALEEEVQKREAVEEEYQLLLKQTGRRMKRTQKAVIEPLICRLDRAKTDTPWGIRERKQELNWMARYHAWIKSLPIASKSRSSGKVDYTTKKDSLSNDQRLTLMEWSVLLQMEELEKAKANYLEEQKEYKRMVDSITMAKQRYVQPESDSSTDVPSRSSSSKTNHNQLPSGPESEEQSDEEGREIEYQNKVDDINARLEQMMTANRDSKRAVNGGALQSSLPKRARTPSPSSSDKGVRKHHSPLRQSPRSKRSPQLSPRVTIISPRSKKSMSPKEAFLAAKISPKENVYIHQSNNVPVKKSDQSQAGQIEFRQEWYEEEETTETVLDDAPTGLSPKVTNGSLGNVSKSPQYDEAQDEYYVAPPAEDDGSEWCKYYDENSGMYYYHNRVTNETQWEDPRVQL